MLLFRLIPVATIFACGASGAGFNVNGKCQVGNCSSPDVAATGTSPSIAFNFIFTLANTDRYRIAGSINASDNAAGDGFSLAAPFSVTYLGNSTGTVSSADVLTIDVLQNFAFKVSSIGIFENTQGGFGGPIAAGSSLSGQLFIQGQPLPLEGPFLSPASFSATDRGPFTGLGSTVLEDLRRTITFAAGSGVGAVVYNALTPGPAGTGSPGSPSTVCDGTGGGAGITDSCQVIACDGIGSTLPIVNHPEESARAASSTGGVCEIVAFDGSGGTLPILVFDGGGSTLPILVFDGGGGTLPILVYDGGGGVIAGVQGGSTLPVVNHPENARAAIPASPGFLLQIATPLQTAAATYTATARCTDGTTNCWITIPVASGSIKASTRAGITALVNPLGLQPGVYSAIVAITIGSSPVLNVPVRLVIPPAGPALALSQTGLPFEAVQFAAAPPAQTISVFNTGGGSAAFTATASTLQGNWLSVSPASGSVTSLVSSQVSVQVNQAGLAPGVYSGRVDFTGPGVSNGTQSVDVVLTIGASGAGPALSSTGLIFVAAGANPPAQTVQITNLSGKTLTATPTVSFAKGDSWFTATASAPTLASSQPLTETVNVNAAGLAPGVYPGVLNIHFVETNADYPVEVLLVVKGAVCTPSELLPVLVNLEGGFQRTAGVPAPLQARVVDDCGTPLTGSALAYFPGGDPPVSLTVSPQGVWMGTWFPHAAASGGPASVGLIASSTAGLTGTSGVRGSVTANPATPLVSVGGVANAASLTAGPVAPGGLVSIFGANLATGVMQASSAPYPTSLGGTSVLLGGIPMPLQVVTKGQINAVTPYNLPAGATQQLVVQQNGVSAMPETLLVANSNPAVFTQDQSGKGAGVIVVVKADGSQFLNTPAKPASAGDALVIYCTGLGAVTPAIDAGSAAPSSPLAMSASAVTATVGGQPANVFFAGLAPGFVGLYQVNVLVPSGVAAGSSVPVVLSTGGASSFPVTIAVR